MLINEQNIVLETCIEVWLETELDDDRIVMAIDMRIYSVEALEELTNQSGKCLWKRDA